MQAAYHRMYSPSLMRDMEVNVYGTHGKPCVVFPSQNGRYFDFESFDMTLAYSAQTLGLSNSWIFWRIRMPYCRQGILAGTVLAFARALGEYGATSMLIGYTPGRTATISTSVYQYWRTGDDRSAMIWVLINLAISAVVLLAVNLLEKKQRGGARR